MRIALLAIALGACSSFSVVEPAADVDGGVDANAPPSASGRFCEREPRPALCADFDGDPSGAWRDGPRTTAAAGGSVVAEAGSRYDGAFGLRARLPANNPGKNLNEVFHQYQATTAVDAFLEARVRFRKPLRRWTKGIVAFLEVHYTDPRAALVQAQITPGPDEEQVRVQLYARGNGGKTDGAVLVPVETWLQVRVEARLLGSGDGLGLVDVEGHGTARATVAKTTGSGDAVTWSRVGFSQFQSETDVDLEVDYDNVVGGAL